MAVQPPPVEAEQGAPGWMVTFADLMSILLTFFILLLSFSSMEIEKFNTLAGAVRSAFGLRSPLDISNKATGSELMFPRVPSDNQADNRVREEMMVVRLREALETSGLSRHGSVKTVDRGVVLKLDGDLFFDSGKTALKPEAKEILDRLVEIAATTVGEIEVQGHTDDVPIRTAQFPSNWELSGARAGSAVRYLTEKGVPKSRVRAIGFADTEPLAPNDSAENRAKNRRVEFLFVRDDNKNAKNPSERYHWTAKPG